MSFWQAIFEEPCQEPAPEFLLFWSVFRSKDRSHTLYRRKQRHIMMILRGSSKHWIFTIHILEFSDYTVLYFEEF